MLHKVIYLYHYLLIPDKDSEYFLPEIISFWFSGAFTGANHVYGWVPNAGYPCGHADMPVYPHAGGLGVVGIGTDAPGSDTNNPGAGALIFGHELIHDYDLKHTNTADACGSNDSSSGFPYSNSSIQEFGFNPITGKVYDPATTHDVMSHCPSGGSKQGWMSPYTWQQMFTDLSSPIALSSIPQEAAPPGVLAPSASAESLQVQATIFNPLTYSSDGGLNWTLIASGLTDTDYLIQTDAMAGGSDVRFRVIATNGVLTGVDETDQAISIPNQYPQASILNPADGGIYPPGSLIVLQGFATDMEDGMLPDEALKWSSDIQGSLGSGPSLALNDLQNGTHLITLWAEDSYGVLASATVKVFIVDPNFLPLISR